MTDLVWTGVGVACRHELCELCTTAWCDCSCHWVDVLEDDGQTSP